MCNNLKTALRDSKKNYIASFLPTEAALLLASTKNRDLWPSPTPKVRGSRPSRHSAHAQNQIGLVLISIYFVYKAIQNRNVVRPGQRSRFLVLTKRSVASGDDNDIAPAYRGGHRHGREISWVHFNVLYVSRQRHRGGLRETFLHNG